MRILFCNIIIWFCQTLKKKDLFAVVVWCISSQWLIVSPHLTFSFMSKLSCDTIKNLSWPICMRIILHQFVHRHHKLNWITILQNKASKPTNYQIIRCKFRCVKRHNNLIFFLTAEQNCSSSSETTQQKVATWSLTCLADQDKLPKQKYRNELQLVQQLNCLKANLSFQLWAF